MMTPKLFETIMILKPETDYQAKIDSLCELFKSVTNCIYIDNIGVKKLAYTCRGYNQGHYLIVQYEGIPHWVNSDLDLFLRKDDDVLKFMTTDVPEQSRDRDTPSGFIQIDLTEQKNQAIDALDVMLGLAKYK